MEDENRRLKSLVADLSLDREVLEVGDPKKRLELAGLREDVAFAQAEHGVSERRACKLLGVDRASYRYEPRPDRNAELREAVVNLARQKPRYGYRRLHAVLERRGQAVNVKRVYRLYAEEGLAVRRRRRKRLVRERAAEPRLIRANQEWAMDFIVDGLANGRMVRILSVVDAFTRECLALEADTSLGSGRVTRVLDRLIDERGVPENVRSDNGPEFTSRRMLGWAEERKITLVHIQPGRPMHALTLLDAYKELSEHRAEYKPLYENQLSEVEKSNPEDAEVQNDLGARDLKSGDLESAIAHLNHAIQLNPAEVTNYVYLSEALKLEDRSAESLAALEKAASLEPINPTLQKMWVQKLVEAGEMEKGAKALAHYLEIYPEDDEMREIQKRLKK